MSLKDDLNASLGRATRGPGRPRGKVAPRSITEIIRSEFMSVAEAQRILGVSRTTVYRGIETGSIPSVRIGKMIRIPVAQFKATFGISEVKS